MNQTTTQGHAGVVPSIVREIDIKGPAARVFAALTDPAELTQWWGAAGSHRMTRMEADLRVGGAWTMHGVGTEGESFTVSGTYRVVEPPQVLEYTWSPDWGTQEPETETVVRIELHEREGVTHLRLTHSGFVDATSKAEHESGWTTVLDWLAGYAETR